MRMYFDFDVNLPDTGDAYHGRLTPSVDYIRFKSKDERLIISIEGGESDFGVNNEEYSARFKELRFYVDYNGDIADKYKDFYNKYKDIYTDGYVREEDIKNLDKLMEILKESELDEIGLYVDDFDFTNPLRAKNLEVEIQDGEESYNFSKEDITLEEYGEDPTLRVENNEFQEREGFDITDD